MNDCPSTEALLVRIVALERMADERRNVINDGLERIADAVRHAEQKAEKASDKAEDLARERQALGNEWRGTVNDVIGTMVPRSEYALAHASLVERVDAISRRVDQQQGRGMGQTQSIIYIFLGTAALISAAGILIDIFVVH